MANTEPLEPPRGMHAARLDEEGRVQLPATFQQYVTQRGGMVAVTGSQAQMDAQGRIRLDAPLLQSLQLEPASEVRLYWQRDHLAIISERVFQENQRTLGGPAISRNPIALG